MYNIVEYLGATMDKRKNIFFLLFLSISCVLAFAQNDLETDFTTYDTSYHIYFDDFVIRNGVLISYRGWKGSVEIPEDLGIVEIGDEAFAHSEIVSVVIPDGVTAIGYAAFNNCNNLKTVIIPDTVTVIGRYAFAS